MWLTLKVVFLSCSASACEYSWSIQGWIHSKRRNRLGQDLVECLVCTHTNLHLDHRLELYETGMLPWDLEITVEEPLSDDEDEGIRLFFYFIFTIIFIFYLHIFVYILSAEPVHTDITRSSLKPPQKTCFFVRHLNFRDVHSLKKKNARLPHVRCGILGMNVGAGCDERTKTLGYQNISSKILHAFFIWIFE